MSSKNAGFGPLYSLVKDINERRTEDGNREADKSGQDGDGVAV